MELTDTCFIRPWNDGGEIYRIKVFHNEEEVYENLKDSIF